jgi:hypothetical protein
MAVPDRAEWKPFAELDVPTERLAKFLKGCRSPARHLEQ